MCPTGKRKAHLLYDWNPILFLPCFRMFSFTTDHTSFSGGISALHGYIFVVVQELSCVWPWSYSLKHSRLLCPPLSPGVCSNSCPLSWWCYLTILSSAVPFSFCLQSFRVFSSESALHIRWPIYWSFCFSNSPFSEYSGFISFRTDWLALLQSKGLSRVVQHHKRKASVLQPQPPLWSNSQIHIWLLEKP